MNKARIRKLDDKFVYLFFNCECKKATDRALLVENEFGETAWVPISQLTDDSDIYEEGDTGTLAISDWFAERIEWDDT